MKRWLLLITCAVLSGVLLLRTVDAARGYVLMTFGHYTIEMSIWVFLLVVIGSFLFVLASLHLIHDLFSPNGRILGWMLGLRGRRARMQTQQGILEFFEGQWLQARKRLSRAAPLAENPFVNYLMAARASQAMGDEAQASMLFDKAKSSLRGADVAVEIARAELQIKDSQWQKAANTLSRLHYAQPQQPMVLAMLRDTYLALSDWDNLQSLLPKLRKFKVADKEEVDRLELTIARARLQYAFERSRQFHSGAVERLFQAWDALPHTAQADATLVLEYVQYLGELGGDDRVEAIIRSTLQHAWSDVLVREYGCYVGANPRAQLSAAQEWIKAHPDNAALLLTLGRLSLHNHEWQPAHDYFTTAITLADDAAAHAELARLLTAQGEKDLALLHYAQAVQKGGVGKLRETPLPASAVYEVSQS